MNPDALSLDVLKQALGHTDETYIHAGSPTLLDLALEAAKHLNITGVTPDLFRLHTLESQIDQLRILMQENPESRKEYQKRIKDLDGELQEIKLMLEM